MQSSQVQCNPSARLACRMPAGWFRIRLKLACSDRTRLELFADIGAEFGRAECIERLSVRGEVARDFFVNIPRPVLGFRLEPLDSAVEFRLETFRIEPVSRWDLLRQAVGASLRRDGLRNFIGIRRMLRLLATGQLGAFKHELLQNLSGPSQLAPPPYDPVRAYAAWRARRRLRPADRARISRQINAMSDPPLVSLLLLCSGDTDDDVRTTSSLWRQLYPHWEVCTGRRGKDSWNSLLQKAAGEFVALIDPGDVLTEHALFAMAVHARKGTADMVYSDEEVAGDQGPEPFFKPDWSPEYALGYPYTGRLAFYRTALVREIGGFRAEVGQEQEYDLVLRLAARSARIEHVADVLYTSPKRERGKPLAHASGSYRHDAAAIEPGPVEGTQRVRFEIVSRPPVAIIIPTAYRRVPASPDTFLARCLASIREKTTYASYRIVLLDNGEIPQDVEMMLAQFHDQITRVPYAKPFNWAAAMNQGAALADAEHLLMLDDDTEVITPDWIECLLEYSQQTDIGAVGARLHFPDGRLQHAGVTVLDGVPGHPFYRRPGDDPGYFFNAIVPRNCSAVTGACLMTRAEVFRSVDGFDEAFGTNFNDIDYCLRVARTGRRIVYTPYARLIHHETATKAEYLDGELHAFRARWQAAWTDPFYNPNLSKRFHDYRIGD